MPPGTAIAPMSALRKKSVRVACHPLRLPAAALLQECVANWFPALETVSATASNVLASIPDSCSANSKVYSAYSVNAAQKKKIAEALKQRLGKEISLSTERDESLLGGILIRAGDLVIDGSVLGRLRAMSASLNR